MKGRVHVFGEVLFDHFPDGSKVLGGAPFNVAWNLQAFGLSPLFISRVGDDEDGSQIKSAMQAWGMSLAGLQTDSSLATGRVTVSLEDGEPEYDIVHPAAYDAISVSGGLPPVGLLYHGSLALRDQVSRETLGGICSVGSRMVFMDVNLRPPWWRRDRVLRWAKSADWVKLNGHELELLGDNRADPAASARDFVEKYGLRGLVLTHGSGGAELFTPGGEYHSVQPEGETQVTDTVGAGDAFSSVMILGLMLGWPAPMSLRRAQQFASAIVARRGATVDDLEFYQEFRVHWELGSMEIP
jgi:fructokinase